MRLDVTNARVGARRARLLGREGLLELLARGAVEAQLEALRATPPGRVLGPGALDPSAAEAGLRAALRGEAEELLANVEGSRARGLLSAWIGLDEAEAVKAIARGLLHGGRADDVLATAPPTPGLDASALRAAVATASVDAALAFLADEAGSPVAAAARAAWVARSKARLGLLSLEIAADRAALARALRAARGRSEDARVLAAHLADKVDARNAATLLALGDGPAPEGVLLDGGRLLRTPELVRLATASGAERRSLVAARLHLPPGALASPARADLALERAAIAPLRREARVRPHSLAVPLAYLAERRAEVRRVSLALRGAQLGLPGDELLALVEA